MHYIYIVNLEKFYSKQIINSTICYKLKNSQSNFQLVLKSVCYARKMSNKYCIKKYSKRWDKGGTGGIKGGIIFLFFCLSKGLKKA